MDDACNLKLQRLELGQAAHGRSIRMLFKKQAETDRALRDIHQIKYILIGAVGWSVLDKFGLIETIKLFLD